MPVLTCNSTTQVSDPPISAASGLETPRAKPLQLRPSSPPVPDDSQRSESDLADGNTPPSSGTTTPTAATSNRRSKSLLGLYPLSGFFRARNSSLVNSTNSVAETSEEMSLSKDHRSTSPSPSNRQGLTTAHADDDDDRLTIRDNNDDGVPGGKHVANGHSGANGDVELGRGEKTRTIRPTPHSTSVAPNAV